MSKLSGNVPMMISSPDFSSRMSSQNKQTAENFTIAVQRVATRCEKLVVVARSSRRESG